MSSFEEEEERRFRIQFRKMDILDSGTEGIDNKKVLTKTQKRIVSLGEGRDCKGKRSLN
jgi:hypothetical protein